jgi:anaerobic selenocysteine-containing dehydrogenase
MCHGGCGVIVTLDGNRVVRVTGDPENPINRGKLCPKAAASVELLYHPDRVLHPLKRKGRRGGGEWERISWNQALDEMAGALSRIKETAGPEYLALAHGTSRPYTDLAGRFCNAFGTPNYAGPSHICYGPRMMATAFTAGTLQVPTPDIHGLSGASPRCLLIWGNNTIGIGAAQGVYGAALEKAVAAADQVIVIDPRRTRAVREGGQWLALRPGTDGALALAMINVIVGEDLYDQHFVEHWCLGFEELKEHVRRFTPSWAAAITGLSAKEILLAARTFARSRPASLVWGNGIDPGPSSFHTARSLMALRAITGNLDVPGGDVFWETPAGIVSKSPFVNSERAGKLFLPIERHRLAVDGTDCRSQLERFGKPWFQLGCGLANRLIRAFYPRLAARAASKAVPEQILLLTRLRHARYPMNPMVHLPSLWDSLVYGDPYRVKALWILGSNPLVTSPRPRHIARALDSLEYLVVSELFMTMTAQQADLILPAATWLEQDDVVNQFKQWCVVARQKVAQVGEARDDREVMIDLARRLDLEFAFPWGSWRAFLDEMLNGTGRDFESFCQEGFIVGSQRYRKYERSGFGTPSGKIELSSPTLEKMGVEPLPVYREPRRSPAGAQEMAESYPLVLTTGAKVRSFFHSEYRQITALRRSRPHPRFEIHPDTAAAHGIEDGTWAIIETPEGEVLMLAEVTENITTGVISADHGWWFPEETSDSVQSQSNVNLLFAGDDFDPESGSEPLRSVLCRARPAAVGVDGGFQ